MSILEPNKWKDRTKQNFFTPRSAQLEDIDRALAAHEKLSNISTITEVDNAIKRWQKTKANWAQSVRNKNGAVDELINAVAEKIRDLNRENLAPELGKVKLKALAPVVRYSTMTDDALVTEFAVHTKDVFKNHWNKANPVATGKKLMEGITRLQSTCQIPEVAIDIKDLPDGYHGFFNFSAWTIELSKAHFSSYDMVYMNPPLNTRPHGWFIDVAETVYHEARHAEQWWHMARYYAMGKKADEVARHLGIPLNIANEAVNRPMKHGDPLLDITKDWYGSVYGGSNRGIVLHALALKREKNPSPKITPAEKGGTEIHGQYSGNLPEEKDAWDIQALLRAKF